jgi:hypothetical protein
MCSAQIGNIWKKKQSAPGIVPEPKLNEKEQGPTACPAEADHPGKTIQGYS